ncbi:hypothetical protein BUALT_Bualt05G0076300 [Buddleja alternifolia]|uniref:J domain-containing protein n=1 Tax=Buddleja alternifolia TaxID=168488 RepID=A0AAV6XQ89_9LAMI|nr:hypothetical protein BUALT_Bualt05G0076300 [Buddleja alternifolia]
MNEKNGGEGNKRELYALLHISPEASDEEIRKAYRQWAQVYHPDKCQSPKVQIPLSFCSILPEFRLFSYNSFVVLNMKEIATENFQRICEAYEILTDENKRLIYDIYGMEGLTSGLELGPKLNKVEEIKEELERLRRQREQEKVSAHIRPSGSILANLSLPDFLDGDGIMRGYGFPSLYPISLQFDLTRCFVMVTLDELFYIWLMMPHVWYHVVQGVSRRVCLLAHAELLTIPHSSPILLLIVMLNVRMAMASEVQSQISKRNSLAIGGNLAVNANSGGGAATAVLRHHISPVSSVELMGSIGLQSLIGVQTSRQLSVHSTAIMGLTMSLRDGSVNLSNAWTRQLSDTTNGNIQLSLGPESSIGVGWRKKDKKMSASGEIKIGTSSFGATAHYTHSFSAKSHGRIAGTVGSGTLALEVGGGRKISKFSTVRMLYTIGIKGIIWRFELHRGGQKLVVPILVSRFLNPVLATGALIIPASLYFTLKNFVLKPYYLKREKQKALENMDKTQSQVQEARDAAKKAQQLLQNVANRKRNKQLEMDGLVVLKALYGNSKALLNRRKSEETEDEVSSQIMDVTVPLNFLVNDSGQLKLHQGVKKSGIMGFCDPCPGEPKQLYVEYTYGGNNFEVTVGDYEELLIPHERHKV